jgi:hypothetical protein
VPAVGGGHIEGCQDIETGCLPSGNSYCSISSSLVQEASDKGPAAAAGSSSSLSTGMLIATPVLDSSVWDDVALMHEVSKVLEESAATLDSSDVKVSMWHRYVCNTAWL